MRRDNLSSLKAMNRVQDIMLSDKNNKKQMDRYMSQAELKKENSTSSTDNLQPLRNYNSLENIPFIKNHNEKQKDSSLKV